MAHQRKREEEHPEQEEEPAEVGRDGRDGADDGGKLGYAFKVLKRAEKAQHDREGAEEHVCRCYLRLLTEIDEFGCHQVDLQRHSLAAKPQPQTNEQASGPQDVDTGVERREGLTHAQPDHASRLGRHAGKHPQEQHHLEDKSPDVLFADVLLHVDRLHKVCLGHLAANAERDLQPHRCQHEQRVVVDDHGDGDLTSLLRKEARPAHVGEAEPCERGVGAQVDDEAAAVGRVELARVIPRAEWLVGPALQAVALVAVISDAPEEIFWRAVFQPFARGCADATRLQARRPDKLVVRSDARAVALGVDDRFEKAILSVVPEVVEALDAVESEALGRGDLMHEALQSSLQLKALLHVSLSPKHAA